MCQEVLIEVGSVGGSIRRDSTPEHRRSLLRCGISSRLMTAVGHSRQIDMLPAVEHVRFAPESRDRSRPLRAIGTVDGLGAQLKSAQRYLCPPPWPPIEPDLDMLL